MRVRDKKIAVANVVYGKQPIQKLADQMIELLIHARYTLSTPKESQAIHSLTKPVGGDMS
jgi:hypothetical protein